MRICLLAAVTVFAITGQGPFSAAAPGDWLSQSVSAQEEYYAEIEAACAYHGCDPSYLIAIMLCESGGDPNAVSREVNGETGTHDQGLFQVNYVYWGWMTPSEQIWFAAEMISNGYAYYWECA